MARNPRSFRKSLAIYKKTVGGTKFQIPIRMIFDGKEIEYFADANEHFHIGIKSKSLPDLYEQLDARVMDKTKIEWESFIEIKFEGRAFSYADNEKRTGLHNAMNNVRMVLETRYIQIGKDDAGKLWARHPDELFYRNPDFMFPYKREDGFQPGRWANSGLSGSPKAEYDEEILITTIPDTLANREALRQLTDKFERLRIALFGIISPENIQKTLKQAIDSSRLLTGMAGEGSDG